MNKKDKSYMLVAISEAELSIRKGNKGFGAVIVRDGNIISKAHDMDRTDSNPLAHAEISAINMAIRNIGPDLSGCVLYSTHEPCPMCSGAIIWSKISKLIYGFSIKQSLEIGKNMVNISSENILKNAPWKIHVTGGFLKEECSHLYHKDVKKMIKKLQIHQKTKNWEALEKEYTRKRKKWFEENRLSLIKKLEGNNIEKAYKLLLLRLGITEEDAPVISKEEDKIVFRSKNFCPTIFACKILGLDTRMICKEVFEKSTEELLKEINPGIRFARNYDKIRPYDCYCEEIIYIE